MTHLQGNISAHESTSRWLTSFSIVLSWTTLGNGFENRALPTPVDYQHFSSRSLWGSPQSLVVSQGENPGTSLRAKALPSSAPIPGALGAVMGGLVMEALILLEPKIGEKLQKTAGNRGFQPQFGLKLMEGCQLMQPTLHAIYLSQSCWSIRIQPE